MQCILPDAIKYLYICTIGNFWANGYVYKLVGFVRTQVRTLIVELDRLKPLHQSYRINSVRRRK